MIAWFTIGIIDGDSNNKLSSIGIDFNLWDENNGLNITNGAVFLLDPNEEMINGNEYIVGQITIRSGTLERVTMNIQGKTYSNNHHENTWTEENMIFHLSLNNLGH